MRGLANVVFGAARSSIVSSRVLFHELASEMERRLAKFNAQDLANTLWAFTTAQLSDELLFVALARAAERCQVEFKPQELTNTVWAFAAAQ